MSDYDSKFGWAVFGVLLAVSVFILCTFAYNLGVSGTIRDVKTFGCESFVKGQERHP